MPVFGGTTFPSALDAYANVLDGTDSVDADHMNSVTAAIEALEAKVGIDDSGVTSTQDYALKQGRHTSKQADGGVAYQFDTLNAFTSGSLVEYLNSGTAKLRVDYKGDLAVGLDGAGLITLGDSDDTKRIVADQGGSSDGEIRYNPTADQWELSNDGGAFSAIQTVAGAGDMQDAYDGGSDIVLTSVEGSIALTRGAGPNPGDGAIDVLDDNSAPARTANLLSIVDQNDGTGAAIGLEKTGTATGMGGQAPSGVFRLTASTWTGVAEAERDLDFYAGVITTADETAGVIARWAWDSEGDSVLRLHGTSAAVSGAAQGAVFRNAALGPVVPFVFVAEDNLTNAEVLIEFREAGGVAGVGGLVVEITAGGTVRTLDGSDTRPAFTFSSDINSGMYRPGPEQLGFTANGVEVLRVDAAAATEFVQLRKSGTAAAAASQAPSHLLRMTTSTWTGAAEAERDLDFYAGVITTADETAGVVARFSFDYVGDDLLHLCGTSATPTAAPQNVVFINNAAASGTPNFDFWATTNQGANDVVLRVVDNTPAALIANFYGNGRVLINSYYQTQTGTSATTPYLARSADTGTGFGSTAAQTAAMYCGSIAAFTVFHQVSAKTTAIVTGNLDGTPGVELQLYNDNPNPAAQQVPGYISFYGEDGSSNKELYAQILSTITQLGLSDDGALSFNTTINGVSERRVNVGAFSNTTGSALSALRGAEFYEDGNTEGFQLQFFYDKTVGTVIGAVDDVLGSMSFFGPNDNVGFVKTEYCDFRGVVDDPSDGVEGGRLEMRAITGGTFGRIAEFLGSVAAAEQGLVVYSRRTDGAVPCVGVVAEVDFSAGNPVFRVADDAAGAITTLFQVDGDGDVVVTQDIEAAGGYKYALWFYEPGPMASGQTDVPLYPTGGGGSGAQTDYVASYGGSVVAITGILSTAVTAGTLSIDVRVGGGKVFQLQFTATDGAVKTVTQAKDVDSFTADQIIDGLWTTDGSFAGPTSMTVKVMVEE